ncbi:DEFB104A-like protein [Gulo gulo luscus]|nr:DEFB104A-like protein [Gulo gulo luscus]KAI5767374.1 DEFB104A-like protein [Gulo gulo luscus]UQT06069.1 DEFB104A [Gulo gulo luscus]
MVQNSCLVSLLILQVRSEFDIYKICGYGTARCRSKCKAEEFQIGACPNAHPCCLKKRTL